jgi:hypothetical protein
MKPSMLKPGDRVRRIGSGLVLAFLKVWQCFHPFHATLTADDADVARHYELIAH